MLWFFAQNTCNCNSWASYLSVTEQTCEVVTTNNNKTIAMHSSSTVLFQLFATAILAVQCQSGQTSNISSIKPFPLPSVTIILLASNSNIHCLNKPTNICQSQTIKHFWNGGWHVFQKFLESPMTRAITMMHKCQTSIAKTTGNYFSHITLRLTNYTELWNK